MPQKRRKRRVKIRFDRILLLLIILLALIAVGVLVKTLLFPGKDNSSSQNSNSIVVSGTNDEKSSTPAVSDGKAASDGKKEDTTSKTSSSTPTESNWDKVSKTAAEVLEGDLIIVNHDSKYEQTPTDLVSMTDKKSKDYSVKNSELQLKEYIIPFFNSMMADFRAETNITNVMVTSGYRTVAYQKGLYDRDLAKTGKDSSTEVAKPGNSEHHTGLALDLVTMTNGKSEFYTGEGKYGWINENCHKYGFIVRYPGEKSDITKIIYEPWHFRYLGLVHAAIIKNMGLCYEEYMEKLKEFTPEKPYSHTAADGSTYLVYYVKQTGENTEIPVPKDKEYTISGNNQDGFIVTVTTKAAKAA